MAGEPTIPEAAVEAAKADLRQRLAVLGGEAPAMAYRPEGYEVWLTTTTRAALAAAEPLMHDECRDAHLATDTADALDRAEAENARLREALEDIEKGIYSGWLARKRAAAALAPSTEEGT